MGCRAEVERWGDEEWESAEDWARGILRVHHPNKLPHQRGKMEKTLNPTWITLLSKSFGLEPTTPPNPELPLVLLSFSIHMAPCHRPLFPSDLWFLYLLKLHLHLPAQEVPSCFLPLHLLNRLNISWVRNFILIYKLSQLLPFGDNISNYENCKGQ